MSIILVEKHLQDIDALILQGHYPQSIEESFKLVGIILTDFFHIIFPQLDLDKQQNIIDELKDKYERKKYVDLYFGAKIRIFIQFKLFSQTKLRFTKECNLEIIDQYLETILGKIDKRIDSAHPEKQIYSDIKKSTNAIDKADALEMEAHVLRFVKILYPDASFDVTTSDDPDDIEKTDIIPSFHDIKLHNLPRPHYFKFIGRYKYINDIEHIFCDPRNFIVSIDGIGGVGKTSLALELAHKFWKERKYDVVVWTTAKKNKLESTGIKNIVPALSNLEELLDEILKVFAMPDLLPLSVDQKKEEIKKLLAASKTLLIVDNLETIDDEKIFTYLRDEIPSPTNIITTTRKKLVEAGRYILLKEFDEDETRSFIDSIFEEKSFNSKLNDHEIKALHGYTGGNPLALNIIVSWLMQGISIDHAISKIKKGEHKILEFCFEETFNRFLSINAQKTFVLFPIFSEEVSIEEIKIATELTFDDLNSVIFELERYTLINANQITKENKTYKVYSMSPVTKMFAYNKLTEYSKDASYRGLEQEARRRLAKYYNIEDKRKEAIEQYGLALEDIGGQSETGRTSALLANSAMAQYQRGSYAKAVELFEQAVNVNPRLSYTFQLWAVVERQQGNSTRAENLFRKAADLNPRNPVIWSSWANMKRDEGDLQGAIKVLEEGLVYAKNAKNKLNIATFNQQLGVLKSKQGNYATALVTSKDSFIQDPTLQERRANTYLLGSTLETYRKMLVDLADRQKHDELILKANEAIAFYKEKLKIVFSNNEFINKYIRMIYRLAGRAYRSLSNHKMAEEMFITALWQDYENEMQKAFNISIQLERAGNFKNACEYDKLKTHLQDCYEQYKERRFLTFE